MSATKKVLVIDDDDIAREVAVSVLQMAGHEVFDLPSPIGATEVILSRGVDVVVLDLSMPSMDGDKFAKLLRGHRKVGKVGIVLVSAAEQDELRLAAARIQADAAVSKADVRAYLVRAVQRL